MTKEPTPKDWKLEDKIIWGDWNGLDVEDVKDFIKKINDMIDLHYNCSSKSKKRCLDEIKYQLWKEAGDKLIK